MYFISTYPVDGLSAIFVPKTKHTNQSLALARLFIFAKTRPGCR